MVEGARSLAHVTVVVLTAQSGRNLRLALAKEADRRGWGGILPPRVVLPMQLVRPADETVREASAAEIAAAFLKFADVRPRRHLEDGRVVLDEWTHLFRAEAISDMQARLSLLDQLADIWRVLAGDGLTMVDVQRHPAAVRVLEDAVGDELERWRELAELETAFFGFLRGFGLQHPSECVRLAKRSPRQVPADTEEIVLPALADPIGVLKDVLGRQADDIRVTTLLHCAEVDGGRFDDYGRPRVEKWACDDNPLPDGIDDADIVVASDTAGLAERVAADFPPVGSGLDLPSLAMVDGTAFPEVSSAFLNAGYVVHNPECHRLAASSLGRLVQSMVELYRPRDGEMPWTPFVAVLRSDDFLKAVCTEGELERADVLAGIDVVQNRFLPQFVPSGGEFDEREVNTHDRAAFGKFRIAAGRLLEWIGSAREGNSLTGFLRQLLKQVFAGKRLTGAGGETEFREAAACVWELLDGLEGDVISSLELSDAAYDAVVWRAMGVAAYSLEPDAPEAVKTEGWLELAWSDRGRFALVGFHEGAVPDSVIGHAFIPDRLRQALGLTSNEQRLARDAWLLSELLQSHPAHSVRVYVARTNVSGDICRPSRLLYRCSEAELPQRVARLFEDGDAVGERLPRCVAESWRLQLPEEVELPTRDGQKPEGVLSPSAIDRYLQCPFTYLLEYGIGMRKVETKTELGMDDFGTLIHWVLAEYANDQISRGVDRQLTDVAAIRAVLEELMERARRPYGEHPSVNVALQLEAAAGRLLLFAELQAQWAAEGWRIVERPEYKFMVQPFAAEDENVWISGSVDRIDYHPKHGYRIIDYKTWDTKDGIVGSHVASGGKRQLEFAQRLKLPLLEKETEKGKKVIRRLLTVQLPLYAKCLEETDAKFKGQIADMCYLLLGKDAENLSVLGSVFSQGRFEAQSHASSQLWRLIKLSEAAPTALATARTAIRHIRQNLFWPPGPDKGWKYNFDGLFVSSPEEDLGGEDRPCAWLREQLKRLEGCK